MGKIRHPSQIKKCWKGEEGPKENAATEGRRTSKQEPVVWSEMQRMEKQSCLHQKGLKLPGCENNPRLISTPGQLYTFDFNKPEEGAKVVPCNNFPDYGTKNFGPHGISIYEDKGETLVFVVNHRQWETPDMHTVEKFKYDKQRNTLEHLKTYSDDLFRLINDILAVGPESFYVTNWIYSTRNPWIRLEILMLQLRWSSLAFYQNGKTTLVADGLYLSNGLNISPDKKFVYNFEMGISALNVYERKPNGSLTFVQSKVFATTACDNMDVDQATGDIWITCHAVAHRILRRLDEPDEHRPLSPSQVLLIKTKDGLLTDDVTEVYMNDGSFFSAGSVAVHHKETSAVLIGSVEKDMLLCQIKTF